MTNANEATKAMAENANFILIECTVRRFTGIKGYKVQVDVVVRRRKSKGPKERYATKGY